MRSWISRSFDAFWSKGFRGDSESPFLLSGRPISCCNSLRKPLVMWKLSVLCFWKRCSALCSFWSGKESGLLSLISGYDFLDE